MAALLEYVRVRNEAAFGVMQRVETCDPFACMAVTAVCRVLSAHEYGERKVTQVFYFGVVGVSRHHRCCRPVVGKTRSQLESAVAAGRVAHHVYFVGVDIFIYAG